MKVASSNHGEDQDQNQVPGQELEQNSKDQHQDLLIVDNDDRSSTSISNSDTQPVASSSQSILPEQEQNTSRLLLLPQELFDHITSYLTPANIVVLALLNKELMSRFMFSSASNPDPTSLTLNPNPNPPSVEVDAPPSWKALNAYIKKADTSKTKFRGSLLCLLDYDLLDLVYCYKCKKMHDPFVTFKDRAYAPWKAGRCDDWAPDHHMPPRATRKLLRSITKRRIHGAEYRHLLQQVNNTDTIYKSGFLAQASLRIRYRDDNQMLRRQQIISSIDKTPLALWLFHQQIRHPAPSGSSTVSVPKVYKICNHTSWHDIYGPMLEQLVGPLCKADHSAENPANGQPAKHTVACFSNESLDLSKQEGYMICERLGASSSEAGPNPMNVPTLLGNVLGCEKCTTDFSLDVVPLPSPFHWGFALTTWMDLGKIDFCSKWDSHRDVRPGRQYNRRLGHGNICEKFEDLPSRLDYRPRVSELDQERMSNYGWGEQAAKGKNRYMSWRSAQRCNPMTGRIEDPDPLEDADY